MVNYTAAQKRAYARRMAAQRKQIAPAIFAGSGAYYQKRYPSAFAPVVARGQGAYNLGNLIKAEARRISKKKGFSRAVGGSIGAALGNRAVGANVGATIGRALGMGDYVVKENTLLQGGIPMVMSSNDRSFVVRHREFLQNIVKAAGAPTFTLLAFPLQPGLSSVFPWLSQMAVGYQQYRIRGMIWEYKGTSSDSLDSTQTSLGSVLMATEYDSSAPPFQNQQQMLNHEFANSCKPSDTMLHAIECKKAQSVLSELYIRSGAVPQGDDERFFDFGTFQIATVGGPTAASDQVLGELWCSYEVEFLKPQLITGLGLQLKTDTWSSSDTVNTTNYFGADYASAPTAGSNLGCTFTQTKIKFPVNISEGTYQVNIYYNGDDVGPGAVAPPLITANASCSILSDLAIPERAAADTSNNLMVQDIVKILAQGAELTLSAATLPTGTKAVRVVINQFNGGTPAV
ncbi:capsid protein [Crucivirus-339]|nr:capsid protein [Crucivirus-339]